MATTEPILHPAAELFPPMTNEEFEGLKADIKENGQREPIIYWQEQLLDGRHRLRACRELGIRCNEAELDPDTDPWKWSLSNNLHRRHLTASQRAMIAAELREHFDEEARERKRENGGDKRAEVKEVTPPLAPPRAKKKFDRTKARDAAGAAVGVSGPLVDAGTKVRNDGAPEVAEMVKGGKLAVQKAAKIVKEEPNADKQIAMAKAAIEAKREPRPKPKDQSAAELRVVSAAWGKMPAEARKQVMDIVRKYA